MQKIAFQRMGDWYNEAMSEYTSGFVNYTVFSCLMAFIYLIQLPINWAITLAGVVLGIPGLENLTSNIITPLFNALLAVGGFGIVFGRMNGRDAEAGDFFRSPAIFFQSVLLHYLISFLLLIAAIIVALPGLILVLLAIIDPGVHQPFFGPGAIISGVLGGTVLLVGYALFMFAPALLVDKELDMITAMKESARVVWGDLTGLIIVWVVTSVISGLLIFCTCCIGLFFFLPYYYIVIGIAYRDYFGVRIDPSAYNAPPGFPTAPFQNYPSLPEQPLKQFYSEERGGRGYSDLGEKMRADKNPPSYPPAPPTLPLLPPKRAVGDQPGQSHGSAQPSINDDLPPFPPPPPPPPR